MLSCPKQHRTWSLPAQLCSACCSLPRKPGRIRHRRTTRVEAQFRGCESAGWCRFRIEPLDAFADSLHRVRPDGVPRMPGNDAISIAVRNRLNALLASMIHQHKRIVLHDLRELDDGTFAATVTVNGVDVASDPILAGIAREASPARITE